MNSGIKNKHILFVVENNSVPFDTRVWNEVKSAQKLFKNVSVICPQPKKESSYFKIIDDIKVYMYPNWIQGSGAVGLILEYFLSFLFISLFSIYVYLKSPYKIVHVANPPDFLSIIFFPYKLFEVKIIYDNHDLSPEVYLSKFGRKGIIYKILMLLERISYKISDSAITVNESFKSIVTKRYRIKGNKITIVRNGPKLDIVDAAIMDNKNNINIPLIGYVGIIDKQDDLGQLVSAIEYIVRKKKFNNFKMLIIGDGTDKKNIENLVKRKGLEKYFIFHGAEYNREKLYKLLHSTEICVDPQLYTNETRFMTAIKIMEYMAVGKPIIQYNTGEGRYSAGESSVYIKNNSTTDFGDAIIGLLKDKKKREYMGKLGRERIEKELQWAVQEKKLLNLYNSIFSKE